MKKEAGVLVHK